MTGNQTKLKKNFPILTYGHIYCYLNKTDLEQDIVTYITHTNSNIHVADTKDAQLAIIHAYFLLVT